MNFSRLEWLRRQFMRERFSVTSHVIYGGQPYDNIGSTMANTG